MSHNENISRRSCVFNLQTIHNSSKVFIHIRSIKVQKIYSLMPTNTNGILHSIQNRLSSLIMQKKNTAKTTLEIKT